MEREKMRDEEIEKRERREEGKEEMTHERLNK